MRRIVPFFFFLSLFIVSISTQAAPTKLNVLSTIKPIHSIVVAIAGDLVNHNQIIPNFSSPHDYSFRPSDIRTIKQADIIFQIDESMESILQPVLMLRGVQTPLISLVDDAKIRLLPSAGSHAHSDKEEKYHQGHHHGNVDYHIWTSTKNSIAMAKVIAKILAEKDPENAQQYQQNLKQFSQSIIDIAKALSTQLASLNDKDYIVFHSTWQYFANEYNLKNPHILSLHEGISPGIKSILETRRKIAKEHVACVFGGPEVSAKRVAVLTENLPVKSTEIDALQSKFHLNKETTINWFKTMGKQIRYCLD